MGQVGGSRCVTGGARLAGLLRRGSRALNPSPGVPRAAVSWARTRRRLGSSRPGVGLFQGDGEVLEVVVPGIGGDDAGGLAWAVRWILSGMPACWPQ